MSEMGPRNDSQACEREARDRARLPNGQRRKAYPPGSRIGKLFGRNLRVSPSTNRKAKYSRGLVANVGFHLEVRELASFMTHSTATAQTSYQHLTTGKSAVRVYQSLEQLTRQPEQEPRASHVSETDTPNQSCDDSPDGTDSCPPTKRWKRYSTEETDCTTAYFSGKATLKGSLHLTRVTPCSWGVPQRLFRTKSRSSEFDCIC